MRIRDDKFTVYMIHAGVYQRGRMHKLSLNLKLEMFKKYDIYNVVALAPAYPDADLQKLHKDYEITYIYRPISDGKLSDGLGNNLLILASKLAIQVNEGYGVLCHCNAGRNRSGLLNALIVRELLHCSGEQALEIVRKARPRAVDNIHFETFLKGLRA